MKFLITTIILNLITCMSFIICILRGKIEIVLIFLILILTAEWIVEDILKYVKNKKHKGE